MKVKICGITNLEDGLVAAEAGAVGRAGGAVLAHLGAGAEAVAAGLGGHAVGVVVGVAARGAAAVAGVEVADGDRTVGTLAGAQVAATKPTGSRRTRVVIVGPALVVGDAEDAGLRRQLLIADIRQRLRRSARCQRQPLIVLNERQLQIGPEQFDFGHSTQSSSAGGSWMTMSFCA